MSQSKRIEHATNCHKLHDSSLILFEYSDYRPLNIFMVFSLFFLIYLYSCTIAQKGAIRENKRRITSKQIVNASLRCYVKNIPL